jgi:hypothetical protein
VAGCINLSTVSRFGLRIEQLVVPTFQQSCSVDGDVGIHLQEHDWPDGSKKILASAKGVELASLDIHFEHVGRGIFQSKLGSSDNRDVKPLADASARRRDAFPGHGIRCTRPLRYFESGEARFTPDGTPEHRARRCCRWSLRLRLDHEVGQKGVRFQREDITGGAGAVRGRKGKDSEVPAEVPDHTAGMDKLLAKRIRSSSISAVAQGNAQNKAALAILVVKHRT